MLTKLTAGRVYDPTQQWRGEPRDLYIRDQQLTASVGAVERIDYEYDLTDHIVMAGGIDPHTHIGGGKLTIARMLLPELLQAVAADGRRAAVRDPLLANRRDTFLPTSPLVGRRYLEMGYTACFEPAMIACNARGTHAEMADVPAIDSGAYVLLGNDDCLLTMIRDRVPQALINAYVAAMVEATQAIGVKVVNAGGIHAFKYNQRHLDVDQPHPKLGVTPSEIIRCLTRAVDEIGLPQPLHVHASNLGMAGNIDSTLKTIAAADGRRIHLTHVQFHSYGADGPKNFSSAAEQIARAVQQHPNLTIDVGQVMFGQTVTLSADTMHQFTSRRWAKPRKSVILDIECQAGCGVVPFRYQHRRFVNALQWAIGLELFLMVDDPSRVFLTTDHPNGGPFTTYPHLMRLLMDRTFRETALAEIDPDAAASSQLRGLTRQYTLDDIALMTRSAPAKFLGLANLGHLADGAVADIAVYPPVADQAAPAWDEIFAHPTHVFRRGRLVVRDGQMIDSVAKVNHTVRPVWDRSLQPQLAARLAESSGLDWQLMGIRDEEMRSDIGVDVEIQACRQPG
ncbi:formylmethanofuran dehydrogenase subunit A [Planctomycetaceae bacterium SH139]